MTPACFDAIALRPALSLLPDRMNSDAARAFILAICLQESGLVARRQMEGGPARGYAQFELGGGVVGVLTHRASKAHALRVCQDLDIVPAASAVYDALEYHDVLTCVFARLLLWTLPWLLPASNAPQEAWRQYVAAWRPRKPRPETWAENFASGWATVVPTIGEEVLA